MAPKKRPAAADASPGIPDAKRQSNDMQQEEETPIVKRKPSGKQDDAFAGTILAHAVQHYKSVMKPDCKAQFDENLSKKIVMGSACTGTGTAEVVHACLHSQAREPAIVQYGCEQVPFKREFYSTVVGPCLSGEACVFHDLHDMAKGASKCDAHRQQCLVPTSGVDIFPCGFSCKDLSNMNNVVSGEWLTRVLEQGAGTSGGTFRSMMRHISRTKPRVAILENVEAIEVMDDEGNMRNIDFLYTAFESIGYRLLHRTLDATSYGLPQGRRRVFVIAVLHAALDLTAQDTDQKLKDVFDLVTGPFQFKMWPAKKFLLDSERPRVKDEIERRFAAAGSEGSNHQWPSFHKEFLKGKGLSLRDCVASLALQANPWYQSLCRRSKQCLTYMLAHGNKGEQSLTSVDLSQRIDRMPKGFDGIFATLTPKADTWIVDLQRLLVGFESLALQGFPMKLIENAANLTTTDPQLGDLAGNAFPSTVFGAVYVAILGIFSFKDRPEHEVADLDKVMDFFS